MPLPGWPRELRCKQTHTGASPSSQQHSCSHLVKGFSQCPTATLEQAEKGASPWRATVHSQAFEKKQVSHTQNWLAGTLLFIPAMVHCPGPRAFNCCCEEHLFYEKPHRSKLTFDIISCRYCNSLSYIPCQNTCNQVHLTENLA